MFVWAGEVQRWIRGTDYKRAQENFCDVVFIILIVVMILRVYTYVQTYQTCTLNMYSLLY